MINSLLLLNITTDGNDILTQLKKARQLIPSVTYIQTKNKKILEKCDIGRLML